MHLFIDRYSIQGFPVVRIVSPHAVEMAKWWDGEVTVNSVAVGCVGGSRV